MDPKIWDLKSVSWPDPRRENEYGYFFIVGDGFRYGQDRDMAKITRITLQEDVPGMHANMRRVCVWSGEVLLAESPYTSVEMCFHLIPDDGQQKED